MNHAHHQRKAQQPGPQTDSTRPRQELNSVAFRATLHCLSGCAVGEVLGMLLGTAWGLPNGATIALAIALAFAFGYAFTLFPLLRSGLPFRAAVVITFAAGTGIMGVLPQALKRNGRASL